MYREWASRRIAGAVLWTRSVSGGGATHRILPDGCLDLLWASGTLMVAGPDTRAWLVESGPDASYLGLRFAPGTGPAVLGVPASELRDARVELTDLWRPARVRRIGARIAAATDPAAALESVALEAMEAGSAALGSGALGSGALGADVLRAGALRAGGVGSGARFAAGASDSPVASLVASLRAGTAVRVVAERAGLSERQLHRRCLVLFGYGPKTLTRVLRFDRAVALARRGLPFADVAARAGYADQAHLSRDARALAGVPLGTLIRS